MELFTIKGNYGYGVGEWSKEIEGFVFNVRGFEFLKLFIYQYDNYDHFLGDPGNKILYSPKELKGKYIVGEATTGLWCGEIAEDPEEAVHKVTKRLNLLGRETCLKAFVKAQAMVSKES